MARLLQLVLAAWLVLAFPMAQQQAMLHALGHAVDPATPAEKCPDHSWYAPFAGAVGCGAPAAPSLAAETALDAPRIEQSAATRAPSPYRSRAPPAAPEDA